MSSKIKSLPKDSVKKLYEIYASTQLIGTDHDGLCDQLFEQLSERIIDRSANNIGELLLQLSRCVDNTSMTIGITTNTNQPHADKTFSAFFNRYAQYLANHQDKENSVSVLKALLGIIRKVSAKRYALTKFLWGCKGFRDLIQTYPKSSNGFSAMSDSVFCSVTDKDSLITNVEVVVNCFTPLFEDKQVHDALLSHINSIITSNKGYTYEDPRMMNRSILSTTDFCVLVMNILIKIMKQSEQDLLTNKDVDSSVPTPLVTRRNEFNKRFADVFWKTIDTVYITTYVMRASIARSIDDVQEQIKSLESEPKSRSTDSRISTLREHLSKGTEMMARLSQYINTIDIEYIDQKIPDLIDHIITTKNFNLMTRLITCFGNRTLQSIRVDRINIAEMILKILKSQDVPPHNKFFAMRLVMSHNLKRHLFSLRDSALIVTQYIMNDVQRLKEIDKLHLIDMLVELSDTSIMSSKNVLELYMYLVSDFNEQYTGILKDYLNIPNESKPDAMRDLTCMIESSALLLRNMPILGRHALSYLNDILSLVETICDSKNILKSCTEQPAHHDLSAPENVTNFENALGIFETMRDKYIEKIKPFIIGLIKVLQSEYTVVIDSNSERIITKILMIDIDKEFNTINDNGKNPHHIVKTVSASQVPEDLMDSIKCDLAVNPYYIKTGDEHNETLHIIDRKTVYSMYRTKTHPFTRQPIDKKMIDDFNESLHIKQLRSSALEKINSL